MNEIICIPFTCSKFIGSPYLKDYFKNPSSNLYTEESLTIFLSKFDLSLYKKINNKMDCTDNLKIIQHYIHSSNNIQKIFKIPDDFNHKTYTIK